MHIIREVHEPPRPTDGDAPFLYFEDKLYIGRVREHHWDLVERYQLERLYGIESIAKLNTEREVVCGRVVLSSWKPYKAKFYSRDEISAGLEEKILTSLGIDNNE